MPKILIVFYSDDAIAGAMANAVAAGAESVRFAEVEVRRVGVPLSHVSAGKAPGQLDSTSELDAYDAIVVGAAASEPIPAPLVALLDAAEVRKAHDRFADKVGSAFTASPAGPGELAAPSLVARLASLGMILIPPVASGGTDAQLEQARSMGRRVAEVTAWVAHSLAHEREHRHGDGSPHDHGHSHGTGHSHEPGHPHEHDDPHSHA